MVQYFQVLVVLLQICTMIFSQTIDIHMPGVQPAVDDAQLCHSVKLNTDTEVFIKGIDPSANKNKIIHHMVVSGCEKPGSMEPVWRCGFFGNSSNYPQARVCRGLQEVMYFWTWNATVFSLPQDIAYAVGGKTRLNYLILQIHYKDASLFNPPHNQTDHTGVTLITQAEKPKYRAGLLSLMVSPYLEPHSTTYVESAVVFTDDIIITPFLYRVHTHSLGRVVSGYRVRDGQWTEIGRRDPQLQQLFLNTTTHMSVQKGDILAYRCTMVNKQDRIVKYGPKNSDEMCKVFIIYYTEGRKLLKKKRYLSTKYGKSWKDFHGDDLDLTNMPETVSIVPGTTTQILETPRR